MKSESILFINSFAIIPIIKNLGQKQLGLLIGSLNLHHQQLLELRCMIGISGFPESQAAWSGLGLTQNYSSINEII
ncbi:hypothetical protein [Sphingobacterium sp.]|uniref:hypothetical protein n=1 Tax=Sphingobacterium sp. TaxID=341027 RepID=UPI0028B234AE|nr:hypothetical protein [Sphingobacterium sp.]